MELSYSRISLKMAGTFRTAKATRTDKQTLWVKIAHQQIEGWGEAVPMDTYGQTLESSEKTLDRIGPLLGNDPFAIEETIGRLLREFDDQRAAVCAVDAAWHDWIGKRLEISTCRMLGLVPSRAPATSFTIGIDEPQAVAQKVLAAASFPILKVKLGHGIDERMISEIRRIAPDKMIRVDANTSWTVDEALKKLPALAECGVEFVEQPLPAGDVDGLRRLTQARICPIVADESCIRLADVVKLAGCVDGVNIKLSKCGGLREALRMIHVAKAHGMRVMLGCMVESSLGIAAAAQLAPLADWLDLDGHLLLAEDPFTGLGGQGGVLTIGEGPGLGVRPRSSF
jgi:L-alanine-DL-glutamate epimerase-like enolase superfamily enzyme